MITKAQMREAGIAAGIPADVVEKLLGEGLVLVDEPYRRVMVRLVLDDGDTFHDANSLERRGWSDWARAEHARGAI